VGSDLAATRYRTTTVKGLNIFYREAGDPRDPALVLLHGFPSSSVMFRDLMPRLADRLYLIAPDYPGFGRSDAPPPSSFRYTFDHLTEIVDAFPAAATDRSLQSLPAGLRRPDRPPPGARAS